MDPLDRSMRSTAPGGGRGGGRGGTPTHRLLGEAEELVPRLLDGGGIAAVGRELFGGVGAVEVARDGLLEGHDGCDPIERLALNIQDPSDGTARDAHRRAVRDLLRQFPVVALLGARLVCKTTLARTIAAAQRSPVSIFDLDVGPAPPIHSSPSAGYADS